MESASVNGSGRSWPSPGSSSYSVDARYKTWQCRRWGMLRPEYSADRRRVMFGPLLGRKGAIMGETTQVETATLAGGCFWCLEAVYDEIEGVEDVTSGYAGGSAPDPTYEQVCSGRTGHAEVEAARMWNGPIVTEVVPLTAFYPAEEYHQEYFSRNPYQPYCQVVVAPKVVKARKKFLTRLKR